MKLPLQAALWCLCIPACSGTVSATSGDAGGKGPSVEDSSGMDASEGDATLVMGILGGKPFSSRSAWGLVVPNGPGASVVAVVIPENFSLSCEILTSRSMIDHASSAQLEIVIETAESPLTPGTYDVLSADAGGPAAKTARAYFAEVDANCGDASTEMTASGSVIISAFDSAAVAGSLDLTFSNGDSVTGEFSAPVCAMPQGAGDITQAPLVCLH